MVDDEVLKTILDKLSQGVIIYELTDKDDPMSLKFKYVNEKVAPLRAAAESPEDKFENHIGETLAEAFPKLRGTELIDIFYKALQTQEKHTMNNYSHSSFYIKEVYYKADIIPISDRILAVIFENTTEMMKMQQQLEKSEEKYRKLIENSPLGILGRKNRKIVLANKVATEQFGYDTSEEFIGVDIADIFPPEEREKILRRVENRKAGKDEPTSYETEFKRKDGTTFPAKLDIGHIEIDNERITMAYVKDITREKKLEQELLIRDKMDSIGNLAGGIVHDFNNILSVIMLNMSYLNKRDDLDNDIQNTINQTLDATSKAKDIISKLRNLTTETTYENKKIDIHEILKQVFTLVRNTTEISIDFEINFQPSDVVIMGDPGHINQVFLNLSTNSIEAIEEKYSKNKDFNPHIKVDLQTISDDRFEFEITFSDNGIGIKEDIQSKIFDPLFTTKENKSKGGLTRGFGLTTVYNIIKNYYDGELSISSEYQKGSKIRIRLPKLEFEEKEISDNTKLRQESESIDSTILIIEDNKELRGVISKGLESYGYITRQAEKGQEGLEILNKSGNEIDLIILDLLMPGMSGSEFIRKFEKKNKIPILISTGYSDEFEIENNDIPVIAKPYTLEELVDTIQEMLKND